MYIYIYIHVTCMLSYYDEGSHVAESALAAQIQEAAAANTMVARHLW